MVGRVSTKPGRVQCATLQMDGTMDHDKKLIRNSTAEFLVFTAQAGEKSIEARYEDDTVWLPQKLMAELFAVDVRTVSEHVKNVYDSEELLREATIRKFRTVHRVMQQLADKQEPGEH